MAKTAIEIAREGLALADALGCPVADKKSGLRDKYESHSTRNYATLCRKLIEIDEWRKQQAINVINRIEIILDGLEDILNDQ